MKQALRNYKRKLKTKTITFYLHERELYEFTKQMNFQRFVKSLIREKMIAEQLEERGYDNGEN